MPSTPRPASARDAPTPRMAADLIDCPGRQHRSAGHPVPSAATRHTMPFIEVLRIPLCFVFPFRTDPPRARPRQAPAQVHLRVARSARNQPRVS